MEFSREVGAEGLAGRVQWGQREWVRETEQSRGADEEGQPTHLFADAGRVGGGVSYLGDIPVGMSCWPPESWAWG